MEKFFADKITCWCLKRNQVSDIQRVAIQYGIELFLDSLLKIAFLLFIGFACGKGYDTVIAIGCFCFLRKQAGGIHMQSGSGCFLSMLAMTVISIIGAQLLPDIPVILCAAVSAVSLVFIYFYAPYSTDNNPITDLKIIQTKKRRAMIIAAVLGMIACIAPDSRLRALILIPVIIEIITILPFWRRKEGSVHDERKLSE